MTDVAVLDDTVIAEGGGLELHQLLWSAATATGVMWAAKLPRSAAIDVVPSERPRPLSELVKASGSWAAVDGGFYDDGPMGLVVSEGVEHHAWSRGGGSGILVGPRAAILPRDQWKPGPTEALQSIDRLVEGGRSLVQQPGPRDARAAVALGSALWLVVAVDDDSVQPGPDGIQLRRTSGRGPTLAELAELLVLGLGAEQALNLDGAVSTQMIVSLPDWRWVVRGELGTINAVLARP